MGKKPSAVTLSEEEKNKLIADPKLALQIETVFDGLFKGKFEEEVGKVKREIEGKLTTLTTVVVLGTVLVLIALIASTWIFMNTYQQHYLDTQSAFNTQINDLRKDNLDLKLDLLRQMDAVKNNDDYLQRLMIERGIQTTQPTQLVK